MTKEEIINTLRTDKLLLHEKFGVINIGLFGSYVRNAQNDNSDLDFLVDLNAPLAKNYFGLWDYLELKFNKKIDLIRKGNHLREKFINSVEKEIIYA